MKQRQKLKYNTEYTRLSNKDSSDDEETELFVRKSNFKEVPTVDINVDEEDTLQAISIRYRCTIEELKRLNNIHKENEIHARRSIKVPSRPFTAALAGIHISGKSSPEEQEKQNNVNKETLNKKLSATLLNLSSDETDLNNLIFNSSIASKSSENVRETEDSGLTDEEVRLLPQEVVIPPTSPSKFTCSGADADISWITLIVCIVVVIFVIPLIYVLYVAEHPEEYHHEAHIHQQS